MEAYAPPPPMAPSAFYADLLEKSSPAFVERVKQHVVELRQGLQARSGGYDEAYAFELRWMKTRANIAHMAQAVFDVTQDAGFWARNCGDPPAPPRKEVIQDTTKNVHLYAELSVVNEEAWMMAHAGVKAATGALDTLQ